MTVQVQRKASLEEYFELEYNSTIRHEYHNGSIRPIAFTSKNHGRIVANISRKLNIYLENSELEIYASDRMFYVPSCNKVYYPDLIVLPIDVETYLYKGKNMEACTHNCS